MHHKRLNRRSQAAHDERRGLFESVLYRRAITLYGIDLLDMPEEIMDHIIWGVYDRLVVQGVRDWPGAAAWFDGQIEAYKARIFPG